MAPHGHAAGLRQLVRFRWGSSAEHSGAARRAAGTSAVAAAATAAGSTAAAAGGAQHPVSQCRRFVWRRRRRVSIHTLPALLVPTRRFVLWRELHKSHARILVHDCRSLIRSAARLQADTAGPATIRRQRAEAAAAVRPSPRAAAARQGIARGRRQPPGAQPFRSAGAATAARQVNARNVSTASALHHALAAASQASFADTTLAC